MHEKVVFNLLDHVCAWEEFEIGDNVVVITNNKTNEQFWLLLVYKIAHVVHESFEDEWGNSYVKGGVVLRGYWYERLQASSRFYTLRDDKPLAYIFSHLIITSKFAMPPTIQSVKGYASYKLKLEVLGFIIDAIEATRFLIN